MRIHKMTASFNAGHELLGFRRSHGAFAETPFKPDSHFTVPYSIDGLGNNENLGRFLLLSALISFLQFP
jgi:hypothetical protein